MTKKHALLMRARFRLDASATIVSLLLLLCADCMAAAELGGACCSSKSPPCVDNVSAGECLSRQSGVYLGAATRCDERQVALCARLPGACCAAARSKCAPVSNYETCGKEHFAGFGSKCDSCPPAPNTTVHIDSPAAAATASSNTAKLIVSGRLIDRQNAANVVSHATVTLMSREHVKLATTRVDKNAEYALQVPASHFASIVNAEHAPFRVVVSDDGLHTSQRVRCYRSRRHPPRHVELRQVPAVRDLPVVCDARATTSKRDAQMRESFAHTASHNSLDARAVIAILSTFLSSVVLFIVCVSSAWQNWTKDTQSLKITQRQVHRRQKQMERERRRKEAEDELTRVTET